MISDNRSNHEKNCWTLFSCELQEYIYLLKLSRGEKVTVSGGLGRRFNSPFAPAPAAVHGSSHLTSVILISLKLKRPAFNSTSLVSSPTQPFNVQNPAFHILRRLNPSTGAAARSPKNGKKEGCEGEKRRDDKKKPH